MSFMFLLEAIDELIDRRNRTAKIIVRTLEDLIITINVSAIIGTIGFVAFLILKLIRAE